MDTNLPWIEKMIDAAEQPSKAPARSPLNVGDVLMAKGDLPGALQSYRASLAIREKLAQKDPDNADGQRNLAINYEKVGTVVQRQKLWAEAAVAFAHVVEMARPWLARNNAQVAWLSVFANGTGHCWELLRDAPPGEVTFDRAKALADLHTARDRMLGLKEQNRLVPPMDKNLPWIEKLIQAAEQPSNAPARPP